jgi:phospholipid/cholesterol/gamma-HCH transport system substrate-binding protein
LVSDGRRTLGDISRAVNNLDKNPTRILFGPSNSTTQEQPPARAVAPGPRAEQPAPRRRQQQ